jgi:hypothetical protein
MKAAIGLGFVGGVLGVVVGLGVIIVATANGDTPYALVDGSIAAAAGCLGVWGATTARSAPRRASTILLLSGIIGFFVVGIVWIVAGGPLITGAFMIRSKVFPRTDSAAAESDDD